MTVNTAVSDVVQVTGVTFGSDMSSEATVIAAISNGTINLTTATDKFLLSVTDGTDTYLYQVTGVAGDTVLTTTDTITLVGVFDGFTGFATDDITAA